VISLAKLTLIRAGLPGNKTVVSRTILLIKDEPVEVSPELGLGYLGSNEFKVEFNTGELDDVNDASFKCILKATGCKDADEVRKKYSPKKTIVKTVTDTVSDVIAPKVKKEVKVAKEKSLEESSDEAVLADESE
jgi:hypothetical protein